MLCRGKSSDVVSGERPQLQQKIERLLCEQQARINEQQARINILEQKVQRLTLCAKTLVFEINLASQEKNRRGFFESLPFAFIDRVFVVEFGLASSQTFAFLITLKSPLEEGGEVTLHISFRIEHPEQGPFLRRRQANDAEPYTFSSHREQQLDGLTNGFTDFVDKSTLLREFQVNGVVTLSLVMSQNNTNDVIHATSFTRQQSAERSSSTPVVRSLSSLDSKEFELESEAINQSRAALSTRRHSSARSQDERQSSSPSPSPLSSHSASPRGRGEVHQFARLSPTSLASPRPLHAASPSRTRSLPRAQTPTIQRSRSSFLPW